MTTSRHHIDDVIVVVPGIMGSTLRRGRSPIWEPTTGAVVEALVSLMGSVRSLRLPDGIGDDHPGDGVEAVDLMPDLRLPLGLWTFDLGYDALLGFLRRTFTVGEAPAGSDGPANLVRFPYDWRLSNRYNGERLRDLVGTALQRWRGQGRRYADAELVIIAHSLGGLVARWYLDRLGGSEVTRKLITLGTPHRGSLDALEQLVNGVRKGPGPFKVNLTRLARSMPSMHQLLPEYACIEGRHDLAKTTEVRVPELATKMVEDAMTFHGQIDEARPRSGTSAYELHPICGFAQPTWVSARIEGHHVIPLRTIRGDRVVGDHGGDGRVPRLASIPADVRPDSAVIRHIADNHGGLVHNQAVFDELEGAITASPVRYRGGELGLSVEVEEVLDPGEPMRLRAAVVSDDQVSLEMSIAGGSGQELDVVRIEAGELVYPLPGPGLYTVTVRGVGGAGRDVIPVTTAVLSWPPESAFDADERQPDDG